MKILTYKNLDLGGGMDNSSQPHLLPDNTSTYMKNLRFSGGKLTKRNGFTKTVNTDIGSRIVSIMPMGLTSNDFMVAITSGGKLLKITLSAVTELAASGYSKFYMSQSSVGEKIQVACGSASATFVTTAGAIETLNEDGLPLQPKNFPTNHNERTFSVSTTTKNNLIYGYNKLYQNVNVGTSDIIRLASSDDLYIFKSKDIYVLRGTSPSNWVLVKLKYDFGNISASSVASSPYGVFAATTNGVWLLSGGTATSISSPVSTYTDNLSTTILGNMTGFFKGNSYFLDIQGTRLLEYDVLQSKKYGKHVWYNHEGMDVSAACDWNGTWYGGIYNLNYPYTLFSGNNDNTAAIGVEWGSKQLDLSDPDRHKKTSFLRLQTDYSTGSTITGTLNYDYGKATNSASYSLAQDGTSSLTSQRKRIPGRGKYVQVKLTESSTNNVSINGFELGFTPLKGRRY